jgi:serine/threonine protein kinase
MGVKLKTGDFLRKRRYEIQQHLGSPCAKEVYLAYDHVFDCQVTIDIFSTDAIMPSGLPVGAWEARVLSKLSDHRNIARVVDYWEDDEAAVMATRYLPGGRLEDLINRSLVTGEALAVQRILQLSAELADGLAHIHQCRLLYCDLQPHNVLFDEWGKPRLVDFDTAVSLDDRDRGNLSHRSVINYMAPELIHGQDADERADLYSLGATIYEMCEGRPPVAGTRDQVLAVARAEPPPLERHDLPKGLRDLVLRLLARNRDQRPGSAAEVTNRLIRLRAGRDNLDRLLASNVGRALKAPLRDCLKADSNALIQSSSPVDGPDCHRYLMKSIIALAETDYRRAVIDAATATEMALRSAISDYLRKRNWSSRDIDQVIWDANGLVGLFARYCSFDSRRLPVSCDDIRHDLAKIRNEAAHAGRIPAPRRAIRAVEVAHALVNDAHPFNSRFAS